MHIHCWFVFDVLWLGNEGLFSDVTRKYSVMEHQKSISGKGFKKTTGSNVYALPHMLSASLKSMAGGIMSLNTASVQGFPDHWCKIRNCIHIMQLSLFNQHSWGGGGGERGVYSAVSRSLLAFNHCAKGHLIALSAQKL